MANERLRHQMHINAVTPTDLATVIEVDPKTVSRWVETGRLPHARHRLAVAKHLSVDETFLWPELLDDPRTAAASQAEVRTVYPHRGAIPSELWRRLIESATENVDVLVYAGLFLVDTNPDLPQRLVERATDGLTARLMYGDPGSDTIAARGDEEGIGQHLSARVQLSLNYMSPALGRPGIEIRQHETVLYNSIYRFDDEMLVNTHVLGSPAGQNPVLHLQRVPGGHLFDHYLASFERVWEMAKPLESLLLG